MGEELQNRTADSMLNMLEKAISEKMSIEDETPLNYDRHLLEEYQEPFELPYEIINSKKELDKYYNTEDDSFYYRGEANSSWICRSTLLREFRSNLIDSITGIPYDVFEKLFNEYRKCHICKALAEIRNTNFYDMWNSAERIEIWLQHWGRHSTLIDFTKNRKYALFFATEKRCEQAEYIRVIQLATKYIEPFTEINENAKWDIFSRTSNTPLEQPARKSIARMNMDEYSFIWDNIRKIGRIDFTEKTYNCRMERQEGILISLGKRKALSLEEALLDEKELRQRISDYHAVEARVTLIHASLIDYIKQLLEKDEIDSDFIYCRDKKTHVQRIKNCPWRKNNSACPAQKMSSDNTCMLFPACEKCPCGFDKENFDQN